MGSDAPVGRRVVGDNKLPQIPGAVFEHSQNPVAYRHRAKCDLDSEPP